LKRSNKLWYARATAHDVEERIAFLSDFALSGDVGRDMEDFLTGIGAHDLLTSRQEGGRSLRALGMQLCAQSAREAVRVAREPIHPSSRYALWSRTRRRHYEHLMTLQANVLHDILSGQPRFTERSLPIQVSDQHQLR
jgi:hypothetical protein